MYLFCPKFNCFSVKIMEHTAQFFTVTNFKHFFCKLLIIVRLQILFTKYYKIRFPFRSLFYFFQKRQKRTILLICFYKLSICNTNYICVADHIFIANCVCIIIHTACIARYICIIAIHFIYHIIFIRHTHNHLIQAAILRLPYPRTFDQNFLHLRFQTVHLLLLHHPHRHICFHGHLFP